MPTEGHQECRPKRDFKMLKPESQVFVLFPDKSQQEVLCEGVVLTSDGKTFRAEFWQAINLVVGDAVRVHYDEDHNFVHADATILGCVQTGDHNTIQFAILNASHAQESRRFVRVSLVNTGLCADIDEASDCELVDVSAEGFAVIVPNAFEVGDAVPVAIQLHGECNTGRACVRSVWDLGDGRWRCGFQAIHGEQDLVQGLERITVETLVNVSQDSSIGEANSKR